MSVIRRGPLLLAVGLLIGCQVLGFALAQDRRKVRRRRAKRPTFSARAEKVFFNDVFAELVGERPANFAATAAPIPSGGTNGGNAVATPSGKWAQLISSSTIEDEIKALKMRVDKEVTTPSAFAGRGYKECRNHFSSLAALLNVIHEYDGDVRWKKHARAARDLFARTAANAKVGTPQVYNEAKLRKQDLQDLVSGSAVESQPRPEPPTWRDVIERGPLMRQLDASLESHLKQNLSSESEFKKNTEEIIHQGELLAAFSEMLIKEGMEDGDDEDYAAYVKTMRDAARDVVEGVKLNDYERARKAIGVVDQTCNECHELYRS